MQLDGIVSLGRQAVGLIHPDLGLGERLLGVAALAFDLLVRLRREALVHVRALLAVRDLHRFRGRHRLRERIGDGQRHVLPVIADDVVFERRARLVDARHARAEFVIDRRARQPADVPAVEDGANARHLLSGARVDSPNFSLGNRAADRHRVHHAREVMVGRVHRLAAHLQRAIDAWLLFTDDRYHRVASFSACTRQRLASSTLKPFWLWGRASRSAASAALRKARSPTRWPASTSSASVDLQGFVPTPPRAMRARAILPPSTLITTAADARANSYEARSRSLRYSDRLPGIGGGRVTCVIRSPGSSSVSRWGVLPGSRWKSAIGMLRSPLMPCT